SSDDHRGYPGAYGEGLVAVWASELSPAAIVDAVRKRRTYAVTILCGCCSRRCLEAHDQLTT
ncbi:MAG: DUF3604 domain-containing protein, partial [Planctomycetes bacterium]|nr:DUF3604 domain-containing protein [Planctomycetota bacterium]